MKRTQGLLLIVCLVISCQLCIPLIGADPFSVHDLLAMKRISDPVVSPDGESIVFVLRSTDLEADRGRTDLWQVGIDGSDLRQLTSDPASDFSPAWHPDEREIWFLSTRSGSSQVWKISTEGGEAVQVTDLPLDVGNLILSPAGDRFFFTLDVFPECSDLSCTEQRLKEREESAESGRLYRELFVRHWDVWDDGRRSHLFSMREGDEAPVDLMGEMEADTPSQPFGGREEITVSPDGRQVVFTAKDADGSEEAWSTDWDLYAVPADGSSSPRCLTEANEAWDTEPRFSPDGQQLLYLAMERPGFESDRFRIMQMSWPDGRPRKVAPHWDRSPHSPVWSANGSQVFVTADHLGQTALFSVAIDSGEVQVLVEEGTVSSPNLAGDRLIFSYDHLRSPAELYSVPASGGSLTKITGMNDELLEDVRMGEPEQFAFEGWNGETVYAYLVKPAEFDEGRRYPVAFLIHGGPQGSFGNHFHYRWNPQTYAGAGYAAVMVDFHGSTGYGQDFTDSISGDWGGKPLVDLQKGLAAALERYPFLDGERVGALGASYGGYMINWIAGNWPDRFRCLVNHDGVFDLRSMYFSTEELWFPEWEFGGPYWEVPDNFAEHNPALHVEQWETPMLVIHGAEDYRVPLEQGLAAFTALQRQEIPGQFLYFPDENHWVLSPANSILWHETVNRWLNRWLK